MRFGFLFILLLYCTPVLVSVKSWEVDVILLNYKKKANLPLHCQVREGRNFSQVLSADSNIGFHTHKHSRASVVYVMVLGLCESRYVLRWAFSGHPVSKLPKYIDTLCLRDSFIFYKAILYSMTSFILYNTVMIVISLFCERGKRCGEVKWLAPTPTVNKWTSWLSGPFWPSFYCILH